MNEMNTTRDGIARARDITELRQLKVPLQPPRDARIHDEPDDARRAKVFLPWLYDYDFGWTPSKEAAAPRPPLRLPPYFTGSFPLMASGLPSGERNTIAIDLRTFPARARVFLVVPPGVLSQAWVKAAVGGVRQPSRGQHPRALPGRAVRVVKSIDDFNQIFGTRYAKPIGRDAVVLEVIAGRRAVLDELRLGTDPATIGVYMAVLREDLSPKTYYVLHFEQYIDDRMMGAYDHLFQAYHRYDLPIIGDRRMMIAYRRSSPEVSAIPPLALAFFDSWQSARAAGFDFAPMSFGKHFTAAMVSAETAKEICAFLNDSATTVEAIVQMVQDNPFVDAVGRAETHPIRKHGIDRATAQRILAARPKPRRATPARTARAAKGPGRALAGFTTLAQVDAVKGVGPDTMSDLISSFLTHKIARLDGRKPDRHPRWQPDSEVTELLKRWR